MAEKSGFFNALQVDGAYDRTYNANDYCDNLAVVISNGVLRSINDDLEVTANGLVPTVAAGRAWIKGHYYVNDTRLSLAAITAPVGGSRYDRIMLRFDNTLQQRRIHIVYVEGTASNDPTPPAPTRTESIYDLVLADLYITANATSMTVTDQRANANLCGWVYSVSGDASFFKSLDNSFNAWFQSAKDTLSSVTLFKRYTDIITLASQTSVVSFNIPQYDVETCFIEVYVNGILDNRYTLNNNVITFAGSLIAGTVVTVNAYKSIDGTGIESVADEITELQNTVATLEGVSNYTYKCTGLNDNISLSQIAQAFINGSYVSADVTTAARKFLEALGGNTYLALFEGQITIDVVGKCGVTTAYSGMGLPTNQYKYFAFGNDNTNDKRIIFDFAKCDKISVECAANTSNYIFYGKELNVKNAVVYVTSSGANCDVSLIKSKNNNGVINFENCKLDVLVSGRAIIAWEGTFTNCVCTTRSSTSSAICFYPNTEGGLIRVFGGRFHSYVATGSQSVSAIICVEANQPDAVLLAENIHCPTVSVTGYEQKNLVVALSGTTIVNGVVSRLTSSGSYYTITNQINKNKV